MSYIYLFDLYKEIDRRLDKISNSPSDKSTQFLQGQLDELNHLKAYLQNQFNDKLPRAVAKKWLNGRAETLT